MQGRLSGPNAIPDKTGTPRKAVSREHALQTARKGLCLTIGGSSREFKMTKGVIVNQKKSVARFLAGTLKGYGETYGFAWAFYF